MGRAGSPSLKSAGSPRAAVPAGPLSPAEESARLKEKIEAKAAAAAAAKQAAEQGKAPPKPCIPEKEDTLTYELKHMAAFDITPVHPTADLLAISRDNVQLLINKLFRLPMTTSEEGMRIQLPDTELAFRIPREKPLPKVKPKTRWEQFAEKKGIEKKKRSKLVWDEESGDWRPRWGFKSVKHEENRRMGIMEVKPGQDPMANPFEDKSTEKQLLKARQKMREIRNKVEAAGGRLKAGAPELIPRKDGGKKRFGLSGGAKRGKEGLREALKAAQIATGSRGKFDRKAPNEATNVQPKRKKAGPPMSASDERQKYLKTVGRVLETATISDSRAAKFAATEEQAANRSRKSSGKGGGKGRGGGSGKRRSKQGRKR